MEVRKIKISPEDESRLRELIKMNEAEVDGLTDAELDALEQKNSAQIQRFLRKNTDSQTHKNVSRFRLPLKSGSMAFLAAAAAILFVQLNVIEESPNPSRLVSKGTGISADVSCLVSVVEGDGTTPPFDGRNFLVSSSKASHLKLECHEPVFVHVGTMQGEDLHLEKNLSNMSVSASEKLVINTDGRVNFTVLVQHKKDLMVLVTKKELNSFVLSTAQRAGYWLDDVPVAIEP